MNIRRAEEKDLPRIDELLSQVLMVHHNARPDLFKADCRKYTDEELLEIIRDDQRPIFAAVDENDVLMGYAFCVIQQHINDNILTDIRKLYIDDLCVDEELRGKHIGKVLYEYVVAWARERNFYNVTLNVWEGNDSAKKFYEACGLGVQKTGMELVL
ncbi:MAG: GNAT family N-acetyltransferase [Eubacterium sp.]|nr:GNAT family N-acetyltransferase [Eubacterium sp.]